MNWLQLIQDFFGASDFWVSRTVDSTAPRWLRRLMHLLPPVSEISSSTVSLSWLAKLLAIEGGNTSPHMHCHVNHHSSTWTLQHIVWFSPSTELHSTAVSHPGMVAWLTLGFPNCHYSLFLFPRSVQSQTTDFFSRWHTATAIWDMGNKKKVSFLKQIQS